MSETSLTVTITPVFMDRLFELEQYAGRENPVRGRRFVDELFEFIYSAVGPFPLAFPAYVLANHPALPFKAITHTLSLIPRVAESMSPAAPRVV